MVIGISRLIIILVIFVSVQSYAQVESWEEKLGTESFFELQKAFEDYWEGKEIPKGAGVMPYKRWEYFMEKRIDSSGVFDNKGIRDEIRKRLADRRNNNKSISNAWSALGPSSPPQFNNGVGRVNVIEEDPNNSNRLFAGTPAGGLWESADGGLSWTTNTDLFPNLGVSNIVISPINSNLMYLGTGDRDHIQTLSFGIMKSTDSGSTWSLTNFQPGNMGLPNFSHIHRILIHPSNDNIMIASTSGGIYRTTDGWTTWTLVLANECLRSMEYHPTDPNIIYGTTASSFCGSFGGVPEFFRSTDNGISWTQTSLPTTTDVTRCAIGVSAGAPDRVLLLASYNDPSNVNDFYALYKSTNAGLNFTTQNVTTPPEIGSQSWYDWTIAVDPVHADTLFAGGVSLYRSLDGGTTWSAIPNHFSVHVDHHYAGYKGNRLYVGSDGGVYRTSNSGATWENLNNGLEITQYYRISNFESNASKLLAGSQDNGTHQLTGSNWVFEFGGDGMDNEVDPNNPLNLHLSYQFGNFFRSTNGGITYSSSINSNITGTTGAWVTPIKLDPSNSDIVYTAYDRVWKSTDAGVSWVDPSNSALTAGKLLYLDIAKSNSDCLYTTDGQEIWRTLDGGSSWTMLSSISSPFISDWIEIDPTDQDRLWVTKGNSIYYSGDGGVTWTDFSTGLPSIPINTIVYDEGTNDDLYVGTDLGVYFRDSVMSAWAPFNTNLPNVIIEELDVIESTGKIRAATHGRGVWEADLVDDIPNLYCHSMGTISINPNELSLNNIAIGNNGNSVVAASNLGYYLSTNTSITSSDHQISTDLVDSIYVNQTTALDQTILSSSVSVPDGNYFLGYLIDYDDQIVESDETDNNDCWFSALQVRVGCTNAAAHNYNANANFDNNNCETCTDGVQNGDETDVDCGGTLCAPCCVNDLTVTNVAAGIYESAQTITTSGTVTVPNSQNTTFRSQAIFLTPGMHAQNGAVFRAYINPCPN